MRQSSVSLVDLDAVRPPRLWQPLLWCRDRAPLLASVAFFAAMFWPFLRKGEEGEWRRCYVRAAERMHARQIIHRPDEMSAYAYPPAMALLTMPLAQLPVHWSLATWYGVNVVAMVSAVICAWRLVGGPSLMVLRGSWSHVFWLALFLASRYMLAPLENQQFDLAIAACLFAGCLALWRGHETIAGLWLGAATAMKCTPLLFAPYLLWRGKVRAAALLVLVAVLLNALPDFLWPKVAGGSYLGDWVGTYLVKVGRSAPGVWESDLILNQSLSGLINRFVQSGIPLTAAQLPSALTKLPPSTALAIRLLTYGSSIGLLAVTAYRFSHVGRPSQAVLNGPGRAGTSPRLSVDAKSDRGAALPQPPIIAHVTASAERSNIQTAVEASAIICLMLLLSPMSSKAHYVALLLPCLVISRAFVEKRLSWKLWLPPLMLFGPLTAKGITGKAMGDLMLAWGFPTWFALMLLVAMWRLVKSNGQ
jgi:hypothetical protein